MSAIRDANRCAICGWTLAETRKDGCRPGDCSLRPSPDHFYDPARARAEYSPYLDTDPRASSAEAATPAAQDAKVKPLVQRRMSDGTVWIDGATFSSEQALRIANDIVEL